MSLKHRLKQLTVSLIRTFPCLGAAVRTLNQSLTTAAVPQATPFGFRLAGHPKMQAGTFEPAETAVVQELLEQVDVLVNVGANIGYYCCLALKAGKRVIAFEPLRRNLDLLYGNIAANDWEDRAEIFPLALTDRIGIIRLFGGGTGASLVQGWAGAAAAEFEWVPASTLDTVLGTRLAGQRCLYIVDIEGAERAMLEGATAALEADPKPVWLVEICIGEHQPAGVAINPHLAATFQWFWERGYEAWTADGQRRSVTPKEIAAIAAGGPDTLKTHNFIFAAADIGRAALRRGLP